MYDANFIEKVQQIILEHLQDENFGVDNLASEIGFSKSQLLRKIKASTGKTISEFIKETRLKEALRLIKETDYTASEISYLVGFSSPSYFNKCFHEFFGVTPGDYNTENDEAILSDKSKESNSSEPKDSILEINKTEEIQEASSKRKKFIIPSIILLLIIAFTYYFYANYTNKTTFFNKGANKKSIAVLPFKDVSQEDTQWFCDGITENILFKLSQISGLTVISRTSSDSYRETDKKIPRIAKELGVSYIVEGSVTIHDDEVKINTQLINSKDEHIWSNEYTDSFKDIFTIQKNVAEQIAEQLQIDLTLEEQKSLSSFPTENLAAYKNYLKARSFAEKGTKEDFDLSIDLYQQSIDLDPNFADAYTEMALSYINNRNVDINNWNQNLNKVSQLVDKALSINPDLAKAYSAKGILNIYRYKDKEAKDNFEKALELNSNDAIAHQTLANYYSRRNSEDLNKGLYHINKAAELDPFSLRINNIKIRILLENGKIIEAEEYFNKKSSLFSNKAKISIKNRIIGFKAKAISIEKKDWNEAIKFYHDEIKKDSQNVYIYSALGAAYNGILNDKSNFLKNAKIVYEFDSTNGRNMTFYLRALLDNEKFIETKRIMDNNNFKNLISDELELVFLFNYYYEKRDYDKALEIANNPLMQGPYSVLKAVVLAEKGDINGVRKILDLNMMDNIYKASVFAILEDRDSMYYYLENEKNIYQIREFNSLKAANPYRKEERYKAFLKKNYLPITHWNE